MVVVTAWPNGHGERHCMRSEPAASTHPIKLKAPAPHPNSRASHCKYCAPRGKSPPSVVGRHACVVRAKTNGHFRHCRVDDGKLRRARVRLNAAQTALTMTQPGHG